MKSNYDVVVVGGGPAGSMAAWEAAKGGATVCMLEKDRDIGYPVRCGEAAGHAGQGRGHRPARGALLALCGRQPGPDRARDQAPAGAHRHLRRSLL